MLVLTVLSALASVCYTTINYNALLALRAYHPACADDACSFVVATSVPIPLSVDTRDAALVREAICFNAAQGSPVATMLMAGGQVIMAIEFRNAEGIVRVPDMCTVDTYDGEPE